MRWKRTHHDDNFFPAVQSETPNIPTDPIIIVGAGMSGLVAAYELSKVGYNVQILEMSERFGGRVKTLDQKDGFDRGLHVDGELAIYSILMLLFHAYEMHKI